MRPSLKLSTLGVAFAFLVYFASAETYYIRPPSSSSCMDNTGSEEVPCLTLVEYATNLNRYDNASNTILVFLPGNHTLDRDLLFFNSIVVTIHALSSSIQADVTVIGSCTSSVMISFNQVLDVYISGLVFEGCVSNNVLSVERFTLASCIFDAQYWKDNGLYLTDVNTASIVNSSFSSFGNGAMSANLTSNLFVLNSTFANNMILGTNGVSSGAALFASNCPNVIISDSTFSNNTVSTIPDNFINVSMLASFGGAIVIHYHNGVENFPFTSSIDRCWFSNNSVVSAGSGNGGAVSIVASEAPSTVMISESIFTDNTVLSNSTATGGAVYLVSDNIRVIDSTFVNNSVQGLEVVRGGAFCTEKKSTQSSLVLINDCTFISNVAYAYSTYGDNRPSYGGGLSVEEHDSIMIDGTLFTDNIMISTGNNFVYGGALSATGISNEANITDCVFLHNALIGTKYSFGGGISSYNVRFTVNNCTFSNNSVFSTKHGGGGSGGAIFAKSVINHINNSTFHDNTALAESQSTGGAVAILDTTNFCWISNSRFINNNVISNSIGQGGALHITLSSINLTVDSCTFLSNSVLSQYNGNGGAMSIYTSTDIHIKNTNITKNSVKITPGNRLNKTISVVLNMKTLEFQLTKSASGRSQTTELGYGGAVAINQGGSTQIEQCQFTNNSLSGLRDAEGGALAIFTTTVTMLNTNLFAYNFVSGYGGAISLEASSFYGMGVLNIQYNRARFGALFVFNSNVHLFGSTTILNNNVNGELSSSIAENNLTSSGEQNYNAIDGGGIALYQSNLNISGILDITNNRARRGGAVFFHSGNLFFNGIVTIGQNQALYGGGIFTRQGFLVFNDKSNVRFLENSAEINGGGVYAIGSNTLIFGATSPFTVTSLQYIANRAVNGNGGGVFLAGASNMYIIKSRPESYRPPTLNVEFLCNSAQYGGAIYVDDDTYTSICTADPLEEITQSGECFLQSFPGYGNTENNVATDLNSVNFGRNNSATKAGAVLYGGLLDRCIINSFSEILSEDSNFENNAGLQRAAFYLSNITNLELRDFESTATISSKAVRVCFCENGTVDCNNQQAAQYVRRAQLFYVSVAAIDQVNNIVPATVITFSSANGSLGEGQSQQRIPNSCTDLRYSIYSPLSSHQLFLHAKGPCSDSGISELTLDVNFLPCDDCPIGFLPDEWCVCSICAPELKQFTTSCSIASTTLLSRNNYWINYTDERGYTGHQCPFDYCKSSPVNVNLTVQNGSDSQCASNRSGWLCGGCKRGFSLTLGGSRCKPNCSNISLFLIIPFALFGITLIVLLLFCNLTVAVGTINGLVFYANIFQANRALFIPPVSANDSTWISQNPLTVFISWVNLDFGIETCFYHGMTAFGKTWFQFLFPLYIITLVTLIILVSKYSVRASKLVTSNTVPCLATLLLLSYTKLLRTIITALAVTNLTYSGSSSNNGSFNIKTVRNVWLVDANVDYIKSEHAVLFLVAFLLLLAGVLFTVLLLIWQCLYPLLTKSAYMRTSRVIASTNHFMEAFHAPFKPHHRYWAGLLLIVRVGLYFISRINVLGNLHDVPLFAIAITTVGLLLYQSLVMNVYSSRHKGFLENTSVANLAILVISTLFIVNVDVDSDENASIMLQAQAGVTYVSVGVAFITFIGISIYHSYKFICQKQKASSKDRKKQSIIPNKPGLQKELLDHRKEKNCIQSTSGKVKVDKMRGYSIGLICEEPTDEDYEKLIAAADGDAENAMKVSDQVHQATVTKTEVIIERLRQDSSV